MVKRHLISLTISALALSVPMSSCIGHFNLTNKVIAWNNKIGKKFVNELVFIAFWIVPVYEVTALADLLVLNSIEFWSGSNPLSASTKVIPTDHGDYLVECDGKGYTVTHSDSGQSMRLEFEEDTQTWNLLTEEGEYPLMTFVDDSHVALPSPDGTMNVYSADRLGVMAYKSHVGANLPMMALNR